MATERLSGRRKAAVLLIALGQELAAQVLRHLSESEIEALTQEILRVERLPGEVRQAILEQCYEELLSRASLSPGGSQFARDLLARSLGSQRAQEVLERLQAGSNQPFGFLRRVDPAQLVAFLEGEHPQTIALVLAHLPPAQAGQILAGLGPELQVEVATRLALLQRTAPEVTREVEAVLKKKLAAVATTSRTLGGVEFLVKVLGAVDARSERTILESIEHQDPELAAEIRQRMFVFEDLVLLDDRAIQRVLREVNQRDLALALKGASEEVRAKILKNMSSRAAQALQEEMALLGPQRLRVVEEAQQRIVAVVRALAEAEEIVISRGREDILI